MDNKEALSIVLNLARLNLNMNPFDYREGPATSEEIQAIDQLEFYHDEVMEENTPSDPNYRDPNSLACYEVKQRLIA